MATVVSPGFYNDRDSIATGRTAQFSVGQTATLILERNDTRIGAVVKNNGATDVWVGFTAASATTDGHVLSPKDTIALVSATSLHAYSPSGTNTVTILEETIRC